MNSVLFISRYGIQAASARYRVYFVEDILREKFSIKSKIITYKDLKRSFYTKKTLYLLSDVLFFHKTIPSNIELYVLKKIFKKKIVLSIDDLPRFDVSKISPDLIDIVLCGSDFLKSIFLNYGFNVYTWPSVPPLSFLKKRKWGYPPAILRVGWVGSTYLHKYIKILLPVIKKLSNDIQFYFITSEKNYRDVSESVDRIECVRFVEWSLKDEWRYFDNLDIVVMPLDESEGSKSKCGFKLLQGMYRGAVPIGYYTDANSKLIQDGYNGFLFKNENELYTSINFFLENKNKLKLFSERSYDIILRNKLYLENNVSELVSLLRG